MQTHATRDFTFTQPGAFAVTLTLTLAAASAPVSCLAAGTDQPSQTVTVTPTLSGHVYTSSGSGFGGVVVSANNGGTTAVSSADGSFAIDVPYNWSGQVAPQQSGVSFSPANRSYSNVTSNLSNQNFTQQQAVGGNQPPELDAPLPNVTVNEDAPPTVLNLSNHFSDPDAGSSLSYSVTANGNPGLVSVSFSGSSMNLSYAANAFGVASITVRAQDNGGLFAQDVMDVTVNAVNDAPSFAAPGNQIAFVGAPLVVQMSSVSPGPSNESGQTVTFTATSSNQSVLPNANLVESGNQISMTAIATGGPVTISVTAQDSGGTALGGLDAAGPLTFNVSVQGAGSIISGTLTPTATVGAIVPPGRQVLQFNGSGSSQGNNFQVTTAASGAYSAAVPNGWTGSVSAADPSHLILWPASRTYSQPVTGLLVNQNFECWAPPLGIPAPPFGIREEAPATPNPWNGAVSGWYYVDNTHPNATNTNNPNGWPAKPRTSIPTSLSAGSVVEVHGGPYISTNNVTYTGNGTAGQPVFIRGAAATRIRIGGTEGGTLDVDLAGAYFVFENFDIVGREVSIDPSAIHLVLRHNRIHHTGNTGSLVEAHGQDIIIYDNEIDHADWTTNDDPLPSDDSGVSMSTVNRLWIVDNDFHENSGDSVQTCHGCTPKTSPRNIYIGRNLMHDETEQAVGFKWSQEAVIVSQNDIYNVNLRGSGGGDAIRVDCEGDEGPIAIIFNRIHDTFRAIDSHCSPAGEEGRLYIIGNVMYNLPGGRAVGQDAGHVVANTIYNGIIEQPSSWFSNVNNLINPTPASAYFVNPASGDFHLLATSAAVDTGSIPQTAIDSWNTNLGIYGLPFPLWDFDGNPRPLDGPDVDAVAQWDLGAHEVDAGG